MTANGDAEGKSAHMECRAVPDIYEAALRRGIAVKRATTECAVLLHECQDRIGWSERGDVVTMAVEWWCGSCC